MEKFTKADLIDILLVCVLLAHVPYVLTLFFWQLFALATPLEMTHWRELLPVLLVQFSYLMIIAALFYLLLFKRPLMIRTLFPGSKRTEIIFSNELVLLTRYGFWIRLIGIWILLRNGVSLANTVGNTLIQSLFDQPAHISYTYSGQYLPGITAAVAILWKADWIADTLMRVSGRLPGDQAYSSDVQASDREE